MYIITKVVPITMPKGSFDNYVDQNLTNFDPLTLEWTSVDIYIRSDTMKPRLF